MAIKHSHQQLFSIVLEVGRDDIRVLVDLSRHAVVAGARRGSQPQPVWRAQLQRVNTVAIRNRASVTCTSQHAGVPMRRRNDSRLGGLLRAPGRLAARQSTRDALSCAPSKNVAFAWSQSKAVSPPPSLRSMGCAAGAASTGSGGSACQ